MTPLDQRLSEIMELHNEGYAKNYKEIPALIDALKAACEGLRFYQSDLGYHGDGGLKAQVTLAQISKILGCDMEG